jgi:hypothetical protein
MRFDESLTSVGNGVLSFVCCKVPASEEVLKRDMLLDEPLVLT